MRELAGYLGFDILEDAAVAESLEAARRYLAESGLEPEQLKDRIVSGLVKAAEAGEFWSVQRRGAAAPPQVWQQGHPAQASHGERLSEASQLPPGFVSTEAPPACAVSSSTRHPLLRALATAGSTRAIASSTAGSYRT